MFSTIGEKAAFWNVLYGNIDLYWQETMMLTRNTGWCGKRYNFHTKASYLSLLKRVKKSIIFKYFVKFQIPWMYSSDGLGLGVQKMCLLLFRFNTLQNFKFSFTLDLKGRFFCVLCYDLKRLFHIQRLIVLLNLGSVRVHWKITLSSFTIGQFRFA